MICNYIERYDGHDESNDEQQGPYDAARRGEMYLLKVLLKSCTAHFVIQQYRVGYGYQFFGNFTHNNYCTYSGMIRTCWFINDTVWPVMGEYSFACGYTLRSAQEDGVNSTRKENISLMQQTYMHYVYCE